MTDIDFTGRVAIVTGGGRGLGRAYALELARRGAAVLVNDLGTTITGEGSSPDPADAVVAEIRAAGGTAQASYDDVATAAGGAAIVAAAERHFGRLDAVVANAGNLRQAPFELWTEADFRAMLDTHVLGAFFVAQPAFTSMRKRGYGRFVFVSSPAGIWGNHLQTGYTAAKAGVAGLCKAVGLEGEPFGIKANAILPVAVTRMAIKRDSLTPAAVAALDQDPSIAAAERRIYEQIVNLRPTMEPEFVAPLVAYLASEQNPHTMTVWDGSAGRYARLTLGVPEGWHTPVDKPPTAEDIRDHLAEINPETPLYEPTSNADELVAISVTRNAKRSQPV